MLPQDEVPKTKWKDNKKYVVKMGKRWNGNRLRTVSNSGALILALFNFQGVLLFNITFLMT
jgi:hypothetical protein